MATVDELEVSSPDTRLEVTDEMNASPLRSALVTIRSFSFPTSFAFGFFFITVDGIG